MAYAEFFVTTACATTSVTMFGVLGPWIELPDAFAPILWIDTTSPATAPCSGLWIQSGTTANTGIATVMPIVMNYQVQVMNYEPGTKWFLPSDIGTKTVGSALGMGLNENATIGTGPRQWKLYYRAVGEGPDPNRMIL